MPMTEFEGPVNSTAFIPNILLMKDKGRKIMVITVNIMIDLP